MTNWRSLPVLHCEVDQPEKGEVSGGLKRIVFVLNLALEKTFKGKKYKKFVIFFSTLNENGEYIFEIKCHEVELIANLERFLNKNYLMEVESTLGGMRGKFSQTIERLPFGRYMAATVVYDEQAGKITLGEEPFHINVTTTSGLLYLLALMCNGDSIIDAEGLVFDYYNFRKLIFYNIDYGSIDFSRIMINIDDYEEWDYYYPEYDREEERNKIIFKEKIEKNLSNYSFDQRELKIPESEEAFFEILEEIITDFKNTVENRAYKLLWDAERIPRDEEYCQILFDVCLDKYCKSKGIDITREPETGRGPIDFRFSSTVYYIAHVEIKKDNNPKLVHGLTKQLPTYMGSEGVRLGFFIVFDFGIKDISNLKGKLEQQCIELEKNRNLKLRIIYIDAKPKLSASNV